MHPEDLAATKALIVRVISGQPHFDFRNRYIRKDGGVVYILWAAFWSEEVGALIGVARDVTALAQAEEELRFLAHHDPLTNRSLFNDRLASALRAAHRHKSELALEADGCSFSLVAGVCKTANEGELQTYDVGYDHPHWVDERWQPFVFFDYGRAMELGTADVDAAKRRCRAQFQLGSPPEHQSGGRQYAQGCGVRPGQRSGPGADHPSLIGFLRRFIQ